MGGCRAVGVHEAMLRGDAVVLRMLVLQRQVWMLSEIDFSGRFQMPAFVCMYV